MDQGLGSRSTCVRERIPVLPVIVIRAVELKTTQRAVFTVDHTVFLQKPFDIETLLTTVEHLAT